DQLVLSIGQFFCDAPGRLRIIAGLGFLNSITWSGSSPSGAFPIPPPVLAWEPQPRASAMADSASASRRQWFSESRVGESVAYALLRCTPLSTG
ncbi:MAG: hypothetical protein L0Y42_08975, partial [Phycisphaerales bacterium]|nr:hypothetical protein [Phycisphaerales bacterium]